MSAVATKHQFHLAGLMAAQGFRSLEAELRSRRTDGRHALEDAILDAALMDAGVIPRDPVTSLIADLELDLRDEWEYDERLDAHIRPA
jgi:hypothetical protein